jgi:general stress protein 26
MDATDRDAPDRPRPLTELMEPGSTLMVATPAVANGDERGIELESRPLTVARVRGSQIEILLDTNEEWVARLRQGDRVHVTMSDNRKNTWVSLSGTASTTADPALIDELWNPFADSYFDNGRDSPGIAVMRIDAERGSYWSGPGGGRLGSLISLVKAKLGDPEQSGDHGDVAV